MEPFCGDIFLAAEQQRIKYCSSELFWIKETAQINAVTNKLFIHLNG